MRVAYGESEEIEEGGMSDLRREENARFFTIYHAELKI